MKIEVKSKEAFYENPCVGDLVDESLVDEALNMLPPITMRGDCVQPGGAHSHEVDSKTGRIRGTYRTFRRIQKNVWMYCGHCFAGENIETYKENDYVNYPDL